MQLTRSLEKSSKENWHPQGTLEYLWSISVNKDILTRLLIGWWLCWEPIINQVLKYWLDNLGFYVYMSYKPRNLFFSLKVLPTLLHDITSHLTHWGRVMHICIGNLTIIGSDNGLSPGSRQAIIWTNAIIFLSGPFGTNVNQMLIEIQTLSFTKIHLNMSFGKWWPSCLGLNVLTLFDYLSFYWWQQVTW